MAADLAGRTAILFKVLALAPAVIIGIPAQALAIRFGSSLQTRLPVLFHRYACHVLGVRLTIEGMRPKDMPGLKDTPVLIASNHVSWLDIIVLGSVMPLSFIAKAEVATWPIFGALARLQRTVFVDRQRRTATSAVNDVVAERLNTGDVMVLFGEGTTSDGSRVLPFRSALLGAARAALGKSDSPVYIQPLSIGYTRRHGLPMGRADRPFIAWYGDMELLPHLGAILAGGPVDVTVCFGEPISCSLHTDRKELAARVEKIVRSGLNCSITGRAKFDGEREAA